LFDCSAASESVNSFELESVSESRMLEACFAVSSERR
jgi:hypothetical protein